MPNFFSKKTLLAFRIPLVILVGIIAYLILSLLNQTVLAIVIAVISIILGSYQLFIETYQELLKKQFALDYIAIMAILVSLYTREFLVGAVIALMLSSGRTLEEYGVESAKRNLTSLINRIPNVITTWIDNHPDKQKKIDEVQVGELIFIRKGEVIPLDGTLISEKGLTDESSLTGEPYTIDKIEGDPIRSGTVNMGDAIVVKVTREEKQSTYHQIIKMVQDAQDEKAPLIRLADRYSTIFTLITIIISGVAFWYAHTIEAVLAVLVVATPCPLILATPIALLGGVNASAKKRIIVKKLSSLEALARVKTIIFDKTGTITLGVPTVTKFEIYSNDYLPEEILQIAMAIERNSLHPLAKAIVVFAKKVNTKIIHAIEVSEEVGKGITGSVKNKKYILQKTPTATGMAVSLHHGQKKLATFFFEDEIKQDSQNVIKKLLKNGYQLAIFTGDKMGVAEKVVEKLDARIQIQADLSPEDKQTGVKDFRKNKRVVAMIGDGINDAPALALADVGLVFSHEEQTAASEAADIVFLGGNFELVSEIVDISKNTINIALQSILAGIGISIVAMIFAAFGFIPPIFGAVLQEAVDVAVIINALRASRVG